MSNQIPKSELLQLLDLPSSPSSQSSCSEMFPQLKTFEDIYLSQLPKEAKAHRNFFFQKDATNLPSAKQMLYKSKSQGDASGNKDESKSQSKSVNEPTKSKASSKDSKKEDKGQEIDLLFYPSDSNPLSIRKHLENASQLKKKIYKAQLLSDGSIIFSSVDKIEYLPDDSIKAIFQECKAIAWSPSSEIDNLTATLCLQSAREFDGYANYVNSGNENLIFFEGQWKKQNFKIDNTIENREKQAQFIISLLAAHDQYENDKMLEGVKTAINILKTELPSRYEKFVSELIIVVFLCDNKFQDCIPSQSMHYFIQNKQKYERANLKDELKNELAKELKKELTKELKEEIGKEIKAQFEKYFGEYFKQPAKDKTEPDPSVQEKQSEEQSALRKRNSSELQPLNEGDEELDQGEEVSKKPKQDQKSQSQI